MTHLTSYTNLLYLEASPELRALFKAVHKVHPSLMWRIADVLAHGV